ncbi:Protein CBG21337, partial [Caenorhabditis briggsae]
MSTSSTVHPRTVLFLCCLCFFFVTYSLILHAGRELERPRWTVTRREETRHSPPRSTSPFQSRSVTTTERVHIVQLPISESSQVSPAHILALSPHGNTSQSVSSIVTTNQVSDSDSLSDDYELVDDNTLTVDVDLTERATSPSYVILSKSESQVPVSPITKAKLNIELEIPPKQSIKYSYDQPPVAPTSIVSEITESQYTADDERQSLTPESDDFEKLDMTYPIHQDYDLASITTTSRNTNIAEIPLTQHVDLYHNQFFYDQIPGPSSPKSKSKDKKGDKEKKRRETTKTKPSHLDYPISEQYEGPLDSTHRASNIHDIPLTTEVSSYPTEYSYEKLPEHVIPVVVEESEKKDEPSLKSKITGLFKKSPSHLDYPISEQYEGPLDSTHRASNIHDIPLTTEVSSYPTEFSYEKLPEHVIPVVVEESEKKDEQSLKSKITGLFKKSPSHLDYPVSDQYEGPLDSTHRASNIHDIPLTTEVSSYPTEFSYEKLPEHVIPVVVEESEKKDEPSLKSKITGLFKKSPSHLTIQYPINTKDHSIQLIVLPTSTTFLSQPNYEKLPEHVVPVVVEESEKKDEQSLKSKITGLFKKSPSHLDYPVSDQYEGPLDSTHRASNIHDIPLTTEVSSYPTEYSYEKLPEHVIPVVVEESEKKDEPSLKSKITGLFKKSPSHLDYPVSDQYEGPLDSTHRASNIHDIPLTTEVSSYPTEFSYEKLPEHLREAARTRYSVVVEESEKKDEQSLKSKITGLFKKSPSHLDYPVSDQYEGRLDSTHRASNIHDIPLTTEVSSYPTEYSYEKLPEHVIPVVVEESEKKDEPSLKSKITGLFKKSPSHLDYPISEQYEGPLDSTHRASNIHDIPLTTEVSSYTTEFSYEKLPEHVIPVVVEESEKKDEPSLKSKITGLFKKSPSHLDYPVSDQYEGPLDSTHRAFNIHDIPLTTEVSSYPTEYSYEKLPEHVIPVVVEESEKKDEQSLKSKITGLFKKSPSHLDYPVSDQYEGPLDSTHRASNIHDIPLTTEVSSYPTEFSYEKLPEHVIPVVVEEFEKKDEPSLKSKITGLFKKSPSHLDYPVSDQYEGPLDSTHRASNIHDIPLTTEVSSYPTEFSYEKLPEHVIPVVVEESEKKDEPSLKSKITGLFKKSPSHLDYPISEQYEGPLDSTNRASNIHDIPLTTEVSSYPTEYSYEKLPEHVIPVAVEESEKKDEPSLKSKITGLFKKSPSHLDYPISEQYEGPLDSTHRASNIHDIPLTTEVSSYPTEFSYEKLPEHVIPVVVEESEKKDEPSLKSKITGLFKKSPSHLDYPISEQYEGPLDSTHRASNIHDIPLTTEVSSYPTEFSYEKLPEHVIPVVVEESEKKDEPSLKSKITGLFKNYEKLPEHVIPVVVEESEKKDEPSLKSKITGLFKKSPSHLDYPISEQYEGPLDSTHRASNIHDIPLTTEVSSYPTEYSYEKLPEHVIPVVVEESEKKDEPSLKSKITGLFKKSPSHLDYPISEQYEGPLDSTHRASNIHDIPLTTEVSSYPTEFGYEKLPEHVIPVVVEESEKKDEQSLKSKITGLFKKSPSHLDYPLSDQYEGPLDSTHRASNIHDIPLTTEVSSYPTEFSYEKLPEHVIPVVVEESEKKDEQSLKSKITGLFKKSPSHLDYPVSDQYEGPLDSTHRASNIHDIPLTTEVSSYPTEFSYEKLPEHIITGLFKKSPSHLDYPISEQYEGPLDSTHRASNIHDIPLTTEVSSYPTEFSYEKLPEHVVPVVVEESEKKDEPSLKSKIAGLFKKSPSHLDYPISEQYEGPLDSTHRASNIHDIPLTTEITGLFKKSPSHLDYPISDQYEGPLDSTHRASNIHDIPLTTEVSSYPTEFSYEKLPEHVIPVVVEESEKKDEPSLKSKITGLFKKSPSHLDYPISEQYEGPLDSTHRASNIHDIPLTTEVSSYPTEFSYEKLPEHVIPVVVEESEKKDEQSLKSKITGLFKKSPSHLDYPVSDQYEGPLDSTHRASNIHDIPLTTEVSSYPTEYSYEKLPEHVIPVVVEESEKKDEPSLKSKITGLFKKSPSHLDYPISEQYEGPLDSTHRASNIHDIPLTTE